MEWVEMTFLSGRWVALLCFAWGFRLLLSHDDSMLLGLHS